MPLEMVMEQKLSRAVSPPTTMTAATTEPMVPWLRIDHNRPTMTQKAMNGMNIRVKATTPCQRMKGASIVSPEMVVKDLIGGGSKTIQQDVHHRQQKGADGREHHRQEIAHQPLVLAGKVGAGLDGGGEDDVQGAVLAFPADGRGTEVDRGQDHDAHLGEDQEVPMAVRRVSRLSCPPEWSQSRAMVPTRPTPTKDHRPIRPARLPASRCDSLQAMAFVAHWSRVAFQGAAPCATEHTAQDVVHLPVAGEQTDAGGGEGHQGDARQQAEPAEGVDGLGQPESRQPPELIAGTRHVGVRCQQHFQGKEWIQGRHDRGPLCAVTSGDRGAQDHVQGVGSEEVQHDAGVEEKHGASSPRSCHAERHGDARNQQGG